MMLHLFSNTWCRMPSYIIQTAPRVSVGQVTFRVLVLMKLVHNGQLRYRNFLLPSCCQTRCLICNDAFYCLTKKLCHQTCYFHFHCSNELSATRFNASNYTDLKVL